MQLNLNARSGATVFHSISEKGFSKYKGVLVGDYTYCTVGCTLNLNFFRERKRKIEKLV